MKFEIRVRTLRLDIEQATVKRQKPGRGQFVRIVGYTTEDYEIVRQDPEDVIRVYPEKGCVIAEDTKYYMVDPAAMEPTLRMMLNIKKDW